jgi:hypothetical protein
LKSIKTQIIPSKQQFFTIDAPKELDVKAICSFAATGFFLDDDTYWKHQKVLQPASDYSFDANGTLLSSAPYFKWHYTPRSISFEQVLDEFEVLFDTIIKKQTHGKKVILPLSGGIDSRMQAVALQEHPYVHSYSYRFDGGYPEDKIGNKIAKALGFEFTPLKVRSNYLWDQIESLAVMNQCYSDFTHPRQLAFVDEYRSMGDVFSLGHWGDVLFDGMVDKQLTREEEVKWVYAKIIKKGGLELAIGLWEQWNLEGTFKDYFISRISELLNGIQIENSSAKLRAFKSMYWAPRWTSVNLSVFEAVAPISLPFYDNRICEFICTIPEEYLEDRKLQIGYIQRKSKKVAGITWHAQKPFNLYNYQWNKAPYNLPYKIMNKLQREIRGAFGFPHISRNWELQFLGKGNDEHLQVWLFESGLDDILDGKVISAIYKSFKDKDAVKYSHPVSLLLTLALFNRKFNKIEKV